MTNTKLFRIEMILNDDSLKSISELIGKTERTLYNKIYNRCEFNATEILIISNHWNLTSEKRDLIFFATRIAKMAD